MTEKMIENRIKKPVIGFELQFVTARHRLCQQPAPQPAGICGGNRFRKEKSAMGPVS